MNPGTELGKYRIVRRVGRGGMADVYEAEDKELGRRVALKLLPPEFARDPERVARFMKEVRSSASLQHPNIIPIYDVGEGDGFHFYTMQLLEGGDLKERIKAGLSQPEALAILKQVAAALGAAHAAGIVHRDVKPENILFDGEGRAILTDLGIAKAATGGTRMTKTGMSIGTPHYMSPEQARGKGVDGRSDIYSLGVMFHEMLTGKVPYDAEESFAVGYMHINEPIPMLPSGLSAYQPMLNSMLGKEPEHRYADCATLIRDVELVESGKKARGVAAAQAGATQVVQQAGAVAPGGGKSGGMKAAMVGALAALLVVGGVFWFMNQDKPSAAERGGSGGGSVSVQAGAAASPAASAKQIGLSSVASVENVLATTGNLSLTSEPSGAQVFLDGVRKGTTPLFVKGVNGGVHSVEFRLDKYVNELFDVHVNSGGDVQKNIVLRCAQVAKMSLTIKADPADATVKILNIKPRYSPGIRLRPGKYLIDVSMPGYESKSEWVNIKDTDVFLKVVLEKEKEDKFVYQKVLVKKGGEERVLVSPGHYETIQEDGHWVSFRGSWGAKTSKKWVKGKTTKVWVDPVYKVVKIDPIYEVRKIKVE